MHVYMCVYMHENDVFKYLSTVLYYICNNKMYYTHKSAFQFKHAFSFEDVSKQMFVCTDFQDYSQTSKKGDTFAITHTYV